jgi:hypothetical protein
VCVFEGQEIFISEQVLPKKRDTRPSYDESLVATPSEQRERDDKWR